MIKYIAKLIIALNSNLGKSQIASGFSWGLLLGLIPVGNIFWIVLFIVSFFFKHHHASKLLALTIFKIISPVVAPLVDVVGWEVLHIEVLQPLFTSLYNMPFVPFTRFNNTLVAGGLVSGIILWLPVFFLIFHLIPVYRNTIVPKIRDSKIVKSINGIPIVAILRKAVTSAMEIKTRIK